MHTHKQYRTWAVVAVGTLILVLWLLQRTPGQKPQQSTADQTKQEDLGQTMPVTIAGEKAREELAKKLSIPIEQVVLRSVDGQQWPDGCLGLAAPAEMCTQAITQGFRVTLRAKSMEYVFHTNRSATSIRQAGEPSPYAAPSQPQT